MIVAINNPRQARQLKVGMLIFFTLLVSLITVSCFASDIRNIGAVADRVTNSFGKLAQLITATSYVAGLGFAIGAVLKFKQHKDNPTQIPVGTPVALLFVAASLLFLPSILETAGGTLFGSGARTSGVKGVADVGSQYHISGGG
jgi:intracellular multiplication protein IcmD